MIKCSQWTGFEILPEGCTRLSKEQWSFVPDHWPVYEECIEGSSIYSVCSQTKKGYCRCYYMTITSIKCWGFCYSHAVFIQHCRHCRHCIRSIKALQDTVEKSGICSPLPLCFHGNTNGHCQVCANSHKALLELKKKQWPTPITIYSTHSHFQQLVLQHHGQENTFSSMGTLFSPCIRV